MLTRRQREQKRVNCKIEKQKQKQKKKKNEFKDFKNCLKNNESITMKVC